MLPMSKFVEIQIRRIFYAPNYTRAFGVFWGIRLLLSIERILPQKSKVVRPVNGPRFPAPVYLRECVSDHAIFWQCLVTRQYDLSQFTQTTRLLEQYRKIVTSGHSPIIIDAGGNIGLAAFWFARTFPEATIISVEPESANFALLQRNVAIFGDRVRPVHGAVTETPKVMRIINPDAGAASFQLDSAGDSTDATTVSGFTIDGLSASVDRGELFIVKIDIEGGQKFLFAENTDWIDKVHLIVIEIDDWQFPWQATCESFFNEMSKRRFDYLVHGVNLFCYRHLPDLHGTAPHSSTKSRGD
jgi:FkbM family methyltransferase